ncbi:MAG: TonB-dependent receptor [Bacteroidales bacterium]|nr:TonB-dependent receptor [Bacteroidales bacterium]
MRAIRLLRPWMMLVLFCCPLCLSAEANQDPAKRHTVSGFIYEQGSRETLIGATVFVRSFNQGTVSNNYGFYSLTLPAGSVEIIFSYVGYQPVAVTLDLDKNVELDIELIPVSLEITGAEVQADYVERISRSVQMSRIDLPVSQIRAVPALFGEKDVFKLIQLLPGVQSGQEGSSGFYVRGGGPDQNLIILDDAIVYNASHLFGFFSIFNGDAIKSVQLYKGGFPARFGGRLSSVLDISMKDGSKEKFQGEAGIGVIASRLTLEGPIVKDKASFLLSGRRTYIDLLLLPLMPKEERGGYFFYDLNAKAHYDLNRKNKLYASGYFGRDKFFFRFNDGTSFSEEGGLYWQNATATLRWNHLVSDRVFTNTSFVYSDYTLRIYVKEKYAGDWFRLSYSSGITDLGIKHDLSWHPSPNHMVRAGIQSIHHRFTPSAFVLKDDYAQEFIQEIQNINTLESGIYIEDEIRLGNYVKINPGFRLSHFVHENKHYLKPEPRFSLLVFILPDLSYKASFASMNQYVHLLSTTGIGLPTDLWIPTTANIKPQSSWQVASGFSKDFIDRFLELSIEGYYKKSNNTIGYREGASFLLIGDPSDAGQFSWEDNITSGQAWAYGIEVFLQKKTGALSGWMGYTLSWTQLQFDEINNGNKFWARYDRRHDFSVVAIYEMRPDLTLSASWVYSTGNALSLPIGEYAMVTHNPFGIDYYYHFDENFRNEHTPFMLYPWQYVHDYENKNSFRAAAYHRFDIGLASKGSSRLFGPGVERSIELNVYNLYNRKNPFFYFVEYGYQNERQLKQLSLFPMIPSLTLNYKF